MRESDKPISLCDCPGYPFVSRADDGEFIRDAYQTRAIVQTGTLINALSAFSA
jgi:hypothetical protein